MKTAKLRTLVTLWILFSNIAGVFMLYGNTVPSWMEPGHVVTLDIDFSAANPLQIGQTVNVTCITHNHLDTATVELIKVAGRSESRVVGHRSPLTYAWTISAADHGTQIYCGSSYTAAVDVGLQIYYAMSDRIALQVQGVSTPATEPDPSEQVYLRVNPIASSYDQYTTVAYVCEVENLSFPPIQIKQRKGRLITTMYTGYQSGLYRWMLHNVTALDDGTQIYCQANTLDNRWNAYSVLGDLYSLNIN